MITIEDCQAFCGLPASEVEALARREGLDPVQACARAQQLATPAETEHRSARAPKETHMMTLQARELFPPRADGAWPLRTYPADSPRALARLLVLALLADGQLDERELATLDRRGAFAALGISREDFVQVLYDFCADVARLAEGAGAYRLSPRLLSALFAEVTDPRAKERLLNLMVAVVSSDGRLSAGEESLFLGALEAWQVGRPGGADDRVRHQDGLPADAYYG